MKLSKKEKEITKRVLKKLLDEYGRKLNRELEEHSYDIDCPSYFDYQGLMDALVVLNRY